MHHRRASGGLTSEFRSGEFDFSRSPGRRGTVIVIVTILVALLALGGYTFAHFMAVESRASAAFGREAQARALADSGVDLAAALLLDRSEQDPQSYYNNSELFQGVLLRDSNSARGRGRFSVVASVESDPAGQSLRFGLIDESSKININKLSDLGLDDTQSRALLMALPLMTEDIADAILDFLDADETPRELGAENEYYGALGVASRNGPLESLDELLIVRGVTPQLLFGEDSNRNGILDPNENDGDKSMPLDNSDGMLFPGWIHFLTIHSRELNVQADGTARIDINMNALGELYDKIEPILGQEAAAPNRRQAVGRRVRVVGSEPAEARGVPRRPRRAVGPRPRHPRRRRPSAGAPRRRLPRREQVPRRPRPRMWGVRSPTRRRKRPRPRCRLGKESKRSAAVREAGKAR